MSFCTLTLAYFCVNSVFDPVPKITKQNTLVYLSLPVSSKKLICFTSLNSFAGAVKAKNLRAFHFYSN